MARSENNLNAVLQDTADAIRSKDGTTEKICPRDFADKVLAIPTGPTPTGTLNIDSNGDYDVTNYAVAHVTVGDVPTKKETRQYYIQCDDPNWAGYENVVLDVADVGTLTLVPKACALTSSEFLEPYINLRELEDFRVIAQPNTFTFTTVGGYLVVNLVEYTSEDSNYTGSILFEIEVDEQGIIGMCYNRAVINPDLNWGVPNRNHRYLMMHFIVTDGNYAYWNYFKLAGKFYVVIKTVDGVYVDSDNIKSFLETAYPGIFTTEKINVYCLNATANNINGENRSYIEWSDIEVVYNRVQPTPSSSSSSSNNSDSNYDSGTEE